MAASMMWFWHWAAIGLAMGRRVEGNGEERKVCGGVEELFHGFCGGWGGLMINAGRSKDAPDGACRGMGDAQNTRCFSI